MLAEVRKICRNSAANAFMDNGRNAYPAYRRQGFEAGRDINPMSVNILTIQYDITKVDSDAQLNPRGLVRYCILEVHAKLNSIHHRRKFH